MRKLAAILSELKRRRVFRVAVVYAGIAFIIFQIVDATFDYLPIPDWVGTALIVVLLLCFPIAVGMAWAFDLTAEGLVRAKVKREPTEGKAPQHVVIGNKTLAIVAALAVIAAAWSWWGRLSPEAEMVVEAEVVAETGLGERSIAVLPFVNFSDSKEDEYFSDGITDDILTHLCKVGDLNVIARTSSMQYKGTDKRPREIAQELGVATILEGSVRRYGNKVRIVSQLIDARTEKHLWADEYDRDLTDIFAIQSDVAQQIAAALKATLTPEETDYIEQKPTDNPEAYDFFLRGVDYSKQEKRPIAIQMYEKAVALDPTFALAYARLSGVHTSTYWFHEDHTPERLAKAKTAVDQALALAPDLPEAHHALGMYYYQGHLDYDLALEEFAIALKGTPNHAETLAYIGYVQRRQGKFEQALVNQRKAYELDPRSAGLAGNLAGTYRLLRRYPEEERYRNRAIALRPDDFYYYWWKVQLYLLWEGNIPKAQGVLDEAVPNLENAADPRVFTERARLHMFAGNYSAALEQLARAPVEVKDDQWNYIPRSLWYAQVYKLMGRGDLAIIYVMVGEYEAAIDKLVYLLSIPGDLSVPWLRLDPTWDPLREHPRFKGLVAGG